MSNTVVVQKPANKEYNPFEHRNVKKPISEYCSELIIYLSAYYQPIVFHYPVQNDIRSTTNLIKSSLGSGLLAGPLAFSNAGWGIGLLGTIIVGVLCGHCIQILVETSRECCKRDRVPSLDYGQTCTSVFINGPKPVRKFAKTARWVAQFALVCTYLGVCCIYTVLISDSIKQIVDRYAPSVTMSIEYYSLIMLIPLILLCQIKYLKWLAIFAMLANILLISTYLICLYYIFKDGIDFSDKIVVGHPVRYPVFIATVIFAMEGVGVVMPIENEMKNPKHFLGFPSVLMAAMSLIVFLYSTLGLFGYFKYGDVLRGSITLNLPVDDWPAICAKVFIACSIFFTYPLQFFVVLDIFTKYMESRIKDSYQTITQIGVRTLGVCFCVAVSIALPLLEQIINIVGSLFYCMLGLIIPSVIETVFRWENLGKYNWILWKNCIIAIFGIVSLISGCTVTVMDIVSILSKKHE